MFGFGAGTYAGVESFGIYADGVFFLPPKTYSWRGYKERGPNLLFSDLFAVTWSYHIVFVANPFLEIPISTARGLVPIRNVVKRRRGAFKSRSVMTFDYCSMSGDFYSFYRSALDDYFPRCHELICFEYVEYCNR